MIRLQQPVILGLDKKPIVLDHRETYHANRLQKEVNRKFKNDLGYEVNITTLTTIIKKISQQSYFQLAPAEYVPIRVGEGAWSTQLTTFLAFDAAGEFETGIINTGSNNARLASADAGVESITNKVYPWAKSIGWTIFDLEFAARSGNWDVVSSKERARKTNWDLGIQRIAFLGSTTGNGAVKGLLNQTGVTIDTTTITKPISTMTPVELKAFCSVIIEKYRANVNRTAWPTRFLMPESDYNGLAGQSSPDFPIKSVIELLEDAFRRITHNPDFKVLPVPYADPAYSGQTYLQYALYNHDDESLRMDIPLDYRSTLANSIDNFSFQNAAYGQFTGVQAYKPLEMVYFRYTPTP